METKEHTRRRRTLRCSLCGLEITEGEDYWYCNGSSVCGALSLIHICFNALLYTAILIL